MGFFSGLFGGDRDITVNIPEIKVPTAQELFAQGEEQAKRISPLAFGAREAGLGRLGELEASPEDFSRFGLDEFGQISPDFFNKFQPSSFEEGIAESAFGSLLERSKREAGQRASLSGIESAFPELFERAIAPGRFQIGQFLSGLGQERAKLALGRQGDLATLGQRQAEFSVQGRQQGILAQLGISPQEEIRPFVDVGQKQGNLQASLGRQNDLIQAQADIANQIAQQKRRQALVSNVGKFSPLGAFALGGIEGGAESLAGVVSSLESVFGAGPTTGANLGGLSGGGGVLPTEQESEVQSVNPNSFGNLGNLAKLFQIGI